MESSQVRFLEFGFLKLTSFAQTWCEMWTHVFKKSTSGLGWVDLDFECSTVLPILPGLMGIWQKWLSSRTRWRNTKIKVNSTQVHEQIHHHPVMWSRKTYTSYLPITKTLLGIWPTNSVCAWCSLGDSAEAVHVVGGAVSRGGRDQLYKNRFSRKIDSQRLFSIE